MLDVQWLPMVKSVFVGSTLLLPVSIPTSCQGIVPGLGMIYLQVALEQPDILLYWDYFVVWRPYNGVLSA